MIAYNTDALTREDDVPDSVFDLTDSKWKGKVGIRAHERVVPGVRQRDAARARRGAHARLARGVEGKRPEALRGDLPVVEAVAAGEIELGLVNHYYLYLAKEENPDATVANHFLTGEDPGALVSVAGAAILSSADHADAAQPWFDRKFLLS